MHNAYPKNASYLIQGIKLGRKMAKMPKKHRSTCGSGGESGAGEGADEKTTFGYKLLTRSALAEKGARENRDHQFISYWMRGA